MIKLNTVKDGPVYLDPTKIASIGAYDGDHTPVYMTAEPDHMIAVRETPMEVMRLRAFALRHGAGIIVWAQFTASGSIEGCQ